MLFRSCHTIQGTEAEGKVGPDLTHFGSRQTIAGLVVPYSTDNLKQWIHNAPSVKPGQPGRSIQMPAFTALTDDEVNAIAAYLESLK